MLDKFYVAYFLFHIVITLLIDATIALPPALQLPLQQYLAQVHVSSNKDLLVASRPIWLQSFVWIEILLQTPLFIWAAYDLSKGNTRVYPAVLIYGVEAATTTFACLAEVSYLDGLTTPERLNLLALYIPTFLIPLYMVYDFYNRILVLISERKNR